MNKELSSIVQEFAQWQKKLHCTLVELLLNWQRLDRQDIALQLLEQWQADYLEGEEERYAIDRIAALKWLNENLMKRLKAEKAILSDWQTSDGKNIENVLSNEELAAMPLAMDAVFHTLETMKLPPDEEVLQKRLMGYAKQSTDRLAKVTEELNANLEKVDLSLQNHLQAWHRVCQKLLVEKKEDRTHTAESVRIHALLAMSAETYLYWQRMAAKGWQIISENQGGMPAYHVTAKDISDQTEQAVLQAGQYLQDIMFNWFRVGTANQDVLMDWLSVWISSFSGLGMTMETPVEAEQLALFAHELDIRSSKMRRETKEWKNFGAGQRLPAVGIPYEIREILEMLATVRQKAVKNASAELEIQRMYASCTQILPKLHEIAKNLEVITDNAIADELESWVHLQMKGFIRLSKISRSYAARAAGLFADILEERIDLERDVSLHWLRLNKKEWDAAQPSSPDQAGAKLGQIILKIGKIRHHKNDKEFV